jgi:outer membrane biosynthesis protein TonB
MRRQRRLMNQINVVPYIDVMLVLLVIFMVVGDGRTAARAGQARRPSGTDDGKMIPEKVAEPGRNKALAFTILVHAGLIAALFLGVQWKRSQPDVVAVELWSSRPAPAVPGSPATAPRRRKSSPNPDLNRNPSQSPNPSPNQSRSPRSSRKPEPPPPRKPDIAIKEEKKPPKPEPKKPEPEPKKARAQAGTEETRAEAGSEETRAQAGSEKSRKPRRSPGKPSRNRRRGSPSPACPISARSWPAKRRSSGAARMPARSRWPAPRAPR